MLDVRIENSLHKFDFDYFIKLRYKKIIIVVVM